MTTRARPIEAEFQSLIRQAFPGMAEAGFPPGQMTEMRRMFMAGAKALFRIIDEQIEPDGPITADELALSEAIEAELEAFSDAVARGDA